MSSDSRTYQVAVHLDRLFKDCPNHSLVAHGGGQGTVVAVVFVTVHHAKQVVKRYLICAVSSVIYDEAEMQMWHLGLC